MISIDESVLRDQVAELIVIRASGHLYDHQRQYPKWELPNNELKRLLSKGVGGVIIYGGSAQDVLVRTQELSLWANKPLLLCADIEEGLGQRFDGGTWLLPPMAVAHIYKQDPRKGLSIAKNYGQCIASQAKSSGINWVLGPVCDVNTNSLNPVINMRSWGEDPETVSKLISAYLDGFRTIGILSCAKHFPGHGDSSVDSHIALPVLNHTFKRLSGIELVPFKSAISSGVDSIMSAHLYLPDIDRQNVTTFSEQILNILLRKRMGFQGLVVTDALVMESVSKQFKSGQEAAMAFAAGADLLLMPRNADDAINAITKALMIGEIPISRLEDALNRRYMALSKVASNTVEDKTINIFKVDSSKSEKLVRDMVLDSTYIYNPSILRKISLGINLISLDGIFQSKFMNSSSPSITVPEEFGYQTILNHPLGPSIWTGNSKEPLNIDILGKASIFLQIFTRGNPFSTKFNDIDLWKNALTQLLRLNRLNGVVVYGSHYFWLELSKELDACIPAAFSPGQIIASQKYVLSSLFDKTSIKCSTDSKAVEFTD